MSPDEILAREILERLHRLDEKQDRILEHVTSLRVRVSEVEDDTSKMHERIEEVEYFADTVKASGKVVIWLSAAIAGIISVAATVWSMLHAK